MYPVLRLFKTLFQAKHRSKLSFLEKSTIKFRCHPWDIDMFGEMNNGRALTLFDLGRMDLAIRVNLMPTVRKEKWGLAVAGSSVRYRKRIKLFDKIVMRSQLVAYDDKWFYFEQSMWVGETACSSVLIRGGITSKDGLQSPKNVLKTTGLQHEAPTTPLWVQDWIDSEVHRPWPPSTNNNQ
ncbi:hypothetical protein MED121_01045 [Marinomonas sp. MED121]|uniref:acyl-CoA thioesterase n=1 Tax=Marinomonas sp. MED121 TaxID=314277 RepID=UPI000068FA27|nr:acyl-CoA thioesterase [Marinomonas sp. MED121]EAQ64175.1 hypothetical protein MED121_01045 [Marinomonas sp. MED121]